MFERVFITFFITFHRVKVNNLLTLQFVDMLLIK